MKKELSAKKNQLILKKLKQHVGKTVTVGYISTCNDDITNIKDFTNTLKGIENNQGKIYLRIEGIPFYQYVSFIGKDFSIVYIKDESNKVIYDNSEVLKKCPVSYDVSAISELVEATFGEEIAHQYNNGIINYYNTVANASEENKVYTK